MFMKVSDWNGGLQTPQSRKSSAEACRASQADAPATQCASLGGEALFTLWPDHLARRT
jgi:hypothetical protein